MGKKQDEIRYAKRKEILSNPRPSLRGLNKILFLGSLFDFFSGINIRPNISVTLHIREPQELFEGKSIFPETYDITCGRPYIVKTTYTDGSSGLKLVFACNPGKAMEVCYGDGFQSKIELLDYTMYVSKGRDWDEKKDKE
jgi:hypothetical protein